MRPYLAAIALASAIAAAGQVASAPAGDEEVIATAHARASAKALTAAAPEAATTASSAPSRPLSTQEQIAAFIAANERSEDAPRGVLPAEQDEGGMRKIHGGMGVSVGTGGYRSAYASALIPVGETATIGIAVSKTDLGRHGGWYDGPGLGAYDDGYGYGYGYGYGRFRHGTRSSIALSVATGGARLIPDALDRCATPPQGGPRDLHWAEPARSGTLDCRASVPPR
jgi:hypothetical protein